MRIGAVVCAVLLVCFVAAGASAQELGGQIRGTVTDKTGAAVPGAKVSILYLQTGTEYKAETNEVGLYAVSNLPVGKYRITITAQGFRKAEKVGVELHASDRLTLDFEMELGAIEQVITVTETPVMVQETPVVQGLISQKQVLELPLNNRNFVQLATLVPGVVDALPDEVGIGLTSVVSVSINGARRNAINWLVDGATNVDVGSNITLLSTPTIDSIAEFKILTSTYSAEWGRSGGGVVNVVTRGGTKDWHASAYEFFRNDALNANAFFNRINRTPANALPKSRLRYNNFGYTVSGPVYIPGVFNTDRKKTFFFWSHEWRRISRAVSNLTATVPNDAFRTGDFSALLTTPATSCTQAFAVCDPTTGAPFAGNRIPSSRFDPNAVAFLTGQLWPTANSGTTGFVARAPSINNTRQESVRVDHNFNDNWRLSGRYTHDLSLTREVGGLFNSNAIPDRGTSNTNVPGQVLVLTLTTVISPKTTNEFSMNISGNKIDNQIVGKARRTDYPGLTFQELFPANPQNLIPSISVTGFSGVSIIPEFHNVYWAGAIRDNYSHLSGKHLFKAGFEVTKERKTENSQGSVSGSFAFNGTRSSGPRTTSLVPFADFLLGLASSYSETERVILNHLRFGRREFYVQDTWKMRPNFTLDLGIRFSYFTPVTDRDDVLTTFDPRIFNPAAAPTFANVFGTALVAGTGSATNGIIIAGVNSPWGKRIYRADDNNWGPRLGFAWDPLSDGKTIVRGGYGIYYDQPLVGTYLQNTQVNPPFNRVPSFLNVSFAAPSGGTAGALGVPSLISSAIDFVSPITQQWNLGIQRQLTRHMILEVGYAGSGGNHLIRPTDLNFGQPADVLAASGATGTSRVNTVRPFRGYAAITQRETSATNRYNALLVNYRAEGFRGLTLNIAYTWSRNITDATNDRDAVDVPQNPKFTFSERGPARTDRTHVFNASYVWEIPWLKSHANQFVRQVVGGWQLSGITSFQSGLPLSRIIQDTVASRRGNRANVTGDPEVGIPAGFFLFNPAVFSVPALGTYGNSGRGLIRGPGRHQWDVAFSKNWYYRGETGRIQFRADMFNLFNHTQFTSVGQSVDAPSTFAIFTAARNPREVQFALKIYY